jgi:hypothetical protein
MRELVREEAGSGKKEGHTQENAPASVSQNRLAKYLDPGSSQVEGHGRVQAPEVDLRSVPPMHKLSADQRDSLVKPSNGPPKECDR